MGSFSADCAMSSTSDSKIPSGKMSSQIPDEQVYSKRSAQKSPLQDLFPLRPYYNIADLDPREARIVHMHNRLHTLARQIAGQRLFGQAHSLFSAAADNRQATLPIVAVTQASLAVGARNLAALVWGLVSRVIIPRKVLRTCAFPNHQNNQPVFGCGAIWIGQDFCARMYHL